jgi:hypothetical protein
MQIGGAHKKMKAQRMPPEYTITEDDGEMIARMVQDYIAEDFDHDTHHKDRIQEEIKEMWKFLKQLGEAQAARSSMGTEPSKLRTEEILEEGERISVHMILQSNKKFHISPSMFHMDEIVEKTPLKDLSQINWYCHGYHPGCYTSCRLA